MVEKYFLAPDEVHPKEPLKDEELGNLLAAIGNHEAKGATLLAMKPGVIYTRPQLGRRFLEVQGETPRWKISQGIPFKYCLQSLSPIGVVAQEYIDPNEGLWGYAVTKYGMDIGVPLVGLLLDFSLKHPEMSLIQLLGLTTSSSSTSLIHTSQREDIEFKKRSPLTRLKILRVLISTPRRLREADLERELNERKYALEHNLHALRDGGFITHEATEPNKLFSQYSLSSSRSPEYPPPYKKMPLRTKEVYGIVLANPGVLLSVEFIADRLRENNPTKKYGSRAHLTRSINDILTHFTREGYLIRHGFDRLTRSEIYLTPEQKTIVMEFLSIIDAFQSQKPDVLQEGREKARRLLSNPSLIAALMEKARRKSPQKNATSQREGINSVASFIRNNPGITSKDLQDKFKESGKEIGRGRINELTVLLEKDGIIQVERRGRVKYYFLSESS